MNGIVVFDYNDCPLWQFTEEELAEHDKQIRAYAIDEYTNMLIEYNQNHYFDELCIEDLREMADELKEQKNG